MILSARPDLVQMKAAAQGCGAPFESIAVKMFASGIHAVAPNGVLGDQRPGDAERGKYYLDKLAGHLVAEIKKEVGRVKRRGGE